MANPRLVAPVLLSVLAVLGALGAWRLYPRWSDPWLGPVRPGWALARRLAWAAKWGLVASFAAGLLASGVLLAVSGAEQADAMLPALIAVFPALMAGEVLDVALSGPASGRAASLKRTTGVRGGGASSHYVCHDQFLLLLSPTVLVALVGFVIAVAEVPDLNSEDIPATIAWSFAFVLILGLIALLRSAVTQAAIEDGALVGGTALGFRRFRYPLDEIQVSLRYMGSPFRELLLVSRQGAWPVLISSAGVG